MLLDLHFHSRHSDGSASVADRMRELSYHQRGTYALTDHDTIDGVVELAAWPLAHHMIPGVEISAYDEKLGSFHLLMYFSFEIRDRVEEVLAPIRAGKWARVRAQVAQLQKYGFPIDLEGFTEYLGAKGHPLSSGSGWFLAEYLLGDTVRRESTCLILREHGSDITQMSTAGLMRLLFKKSGSLSHVGTVAVERYEPHIEDIVARFRGDAHFVIAHPNTSFPPPVKGIESRVYFSETVVPRIADLGIRNLEINARASHDWAEDILHARSYLGGIVTSGSDNHDPGTSDRMHGLLGAMHPILRNWDPLRHTIAELSQYQI